MGGKRQREKAHVSELRMVRYSGCDTGRDGAIE